MKRKSIVFLIGLIVSLSVAAGVSAKRRSIADLEANPTKYQNKTVTIVGIVRDADGISIPIIGISGGCYKVDDGTGSIWVCTEDGVPTKGAEVKVKGKLQTGAVYKGKNYGLVIIEKYRDYHKRKNSIKNDKKGTTG
jgi:hypothetical protein